MHRPVRTCIGCRGREDKSDLLRIVWRTEPTLNREVGPAVDPGQTAPGRGAYLHRRTACLESAVKRRSFTRAWRLDAGQGVDPEALRVAVAPHLEGVQETAN